jgi:hypothetical protein
MQPAVKKYKLEREQRSAYVLLRLDLKVGELTKWGPGRRWKVVEVHEQTTKPLQVFHA